MRRERIPDLISEINDELDLINWLVADIKEVNNAKPASLKKKRIYEESLALKVHNFYTGCERIFQKIADDINGGVPASRDWHKRLLRSMSLEIENIRPSSLLQKSEKENCLSFPRKWESSIFNGLHNTLDSRFHGNDDFCKSLHL